MNNPRLACFLLSERKAHGTFEKKMITLITVEHKFKPEEKILL